MKANHPEKEREEMIYGKKNVSRNHYCVWEAGENGTRFRAMAPNLQINLAISPHGFGRRLKVKGFVRIVSFVSFRSYDLGPHVT